MRDGAWGSGTSSPDDGSGRTKAAAGEPTDLMWLREGAQGAGEVADNGGTPGEPHEPSEALYDAARDSIHVHVDPGGSTFTERNGSVAHESAGAETDGEVVRATRLRGRDRGRWRMDGRRRGLFFEISTTKGSSTTYQRVPRGLHRHQTNPYSDQTYLRASSSRGRISITSCDGKLTDDEAHASGIPSRDEDAR